jgi:hypothetical protein
MFTKLRHRDRQKVFGEGRCLPLDRNAKARIKALARALTRRTEKGKRYGVITVKFLAVLDALLWGFDNSGRGRPRQDQGMDRRRRTPTPRHH